MMQEELDLTLADIEHLFDVRLRLEQAIEEMVFLMARPSTPTHLAGNPRAAVRETVERVLEGLEAA